MKERPKFNPGWHTSISNEDYHGSSGWSSSDLKVLLEQTPSMLKHRKDEPRDEPSATQMRGTALHSLVLEPENFNNDVIIHPGNIRKPTDAQRNSKNSSESSLANIAAYDKFQVDSKGKAVITKEVFEEVQKMADNARNHPVIGKLLADIYAETSVYGWYSPYDYEDRTENSMMFKCRPDAVARGYPVIIDIKSTKDATQTSFSRDIIKYHYNMSAAMYLNLCNQCPELLEAVGVKAFTHFVFVCIENVPPYQVNWCELSLLEDSSSYRSYDIGRTQYKIAARRLSSAIENGFESFSLDPWQVELPPWAERGHII